MTSDLAFKTSMTFAYGVPSPISPGVVRVVAENPSPLTFKGTNTYLVGMTRLAVIDPGPADDAHLAAVLAATAGREVTHIFITHAHRDHVDGAERLKAMTGAPILGYGRERETRRPVFTPSGEEFVDYAFVPDVTIDDGDIVEGTDWRLAAVHTPGHAPDHLCFAMLGRSLLFSGDHVMAWNTTLIAPPEGSMADYTTSLQRLFARSETLYLPGHGGRLHEPHRTVKAYLLHRQWREQSVVAAIRKGAHTITTIVPLVYPTIDEPLVKAASLSVLAHVEHLMERGLVTCDGSPTQDHRLSLA